MISSLYLHTLSRKRHICALKMWKKTETTTKKPENTIQLIKTNRKNCAQGPGIGAKGADAGEGVECAEPPHPLSSIIGPFEDLNSTLIGP